MADVTVYGLTPVTTVVDTDLLMVVDTSDTSQSANGSTRKVTLANFLNYVQTAWSGENAEFDGIGIGKAGVTDKIMFENAGTIDVDDDDLTIDCGTDKTLVLATPVYNDLVMPIATGKVPTTNAPTWTAYSSNMNSYTFDIDDYIDLQGTEILHDYAEGTDFDIHLHIITNTLDTNERKAKYRIYYDVGDMGEAMAGESSATAELTIPANTPAHTHFYLDMGTITGTTYKIGALVKARVERIAGTGTEPTDDPFLEMVGIHYQVDTMGSRTESAK